MDLYKQFFSLEIDQDALGLIKARESIPYFCTPIGSKVFAHLGVDGIHFCTIPSLDSSMVFVVSPIPCSDQHVLPVAHNFKDFLSLVLACNGASLLEQISSIDEELFLSLQITESSAITLEQEQALTALKETFNIQSLKDPYTYVKDIQTHFDYESIPFSDEYYDVTGKTPPIH